MQDADYSLESDLMAAFEQGEESAYTQVFNQFFDPLYGFALKMIHNEPEAEDIVMQTFTNLFIKKRDFATLINIKAFLYISVRNSCLNYLRRVVVISESQKRYRELVEMDSNTENVQLDMEMMIALGNSMKQLSDKNRELLDLLYIKGMKYKEVAKQLGISVETVKSQRRDTLARLRKTMPRRLPITLFLRISKKISFFSPPYYPSACF